LGKLTDNIEWARMQFKPSKLRSISIVMGKVVDKTFFINGESIPTVSEKPVKSLGRWYDGDLKDTVRVGKVRVGLYSKGILQLPVSAFTEEFKCTNVRLAMTLVESCEKCVREAAPVLKTGRKWSAKKSKWQKTGPAQRIKLVVNEVRKQEKRMRCIKAISQAKQGEWMRWESVEQRKMGWQDTQKTTFLRSGEQPPRKGVKINSGKCWLILISGLLFPPEIATPSDQILFCGLHQHALFN